MKGEIAGTPKGAADQPGDTRRQGVIAGILAYGLWGLFPLYFHLLSPTEPLEILAHRIVWSFLLVAGVLWFRRDRGEQDELRSLWHDRRRLAMITAAGVLLAINWLTYIAAVSADRVLDASLGYFINPLFTVLLGVWLLHERLRLLQWIAVGLGALAVLVLTLGYGQVPWVALILAISFGLYGYLKKQVHLTTLPSLAAETVGLVPLALGYLVWSATAGTLAFGHVSWKLNLLLLASGAVTAAPLLAFGVATRAIPLSLLGLLQYITPVVQFMIGFWLFDEHVPSARWAGFALIWAALVVLTIDGFRAGDAALRSAPRSSRPASS